MKAYSYREQIGGWQRQGVRNVWTKSKGTNFSSFEISQEYIMFSTATIDNNVLHI